MIYGAVLGAIAGAFLANQYDGNTIGVAMIGAAIGAAYFAYQNQ